MTEVVPDGAAKQTNLATSSPTVDETGEHPREMLRGALSELGTLSKELMAAQAELERVTAETAEKLRKDSEAATWDADERRRKSEAAAKKESSEKLIAAEATAKASDTTLRDQYGKVVLAARRSADEQISTVRKSVQEGEWLADSLLEGAESAARKHTKEANEARDRATLDIADREAAVIETLSQYGMQHLVTEPAATEALTPIGDEIDERHAKELLEKELALLGGAQKQLATLELARAFVGPMPYVLGIVLVALAGFVGQLTTGGMTFSPLRVAIGAGVGMFIAMVAGVGLKVAANRKVKKLYVPIRKHAEQARAWVTAVYDRSSERITSDRDAAKARREFDVRSVRDKHQPVLEKITAQLKEKNNAAEAELASRSAAIKKQREASLAEAAEWFERRTGEIVQRHSSETSGNTALVAKKEQAGADAHATGRAVLLARWNAGLARIARATNVGTHVDGTGPLAWSAGTFQNNGWRGPKSFPKGVRFGSLAVNAAELVHREAAAEEAFPFGDTLPERFEVPAMLGFGDGAPSPAGSMMIDFDRAGRESALSLLRETMARLMIAIPPGRARLTMIDPVGLGETFAGFMHLADYDEQLTGARIWTDSEGIDRKLTDLTDHMQTVIQKYLRNEYETIDAYNAQAGELAEPYRFLVVADFPTAWSAESIRKLSSILASGARCGLHVLMARDTRVAVEKRVLEDLRAGMTVIELASKDGAGKDGTGREGAAAPTASWRDEVFGRFPLTPDAEPDDATLTALCNAVGEGAKRANRVEVDVNAVLPSAAERWTWSASEEFKIPVGRSGATRLQYLKLGKGVSQHGLLAGKTGSGKSTLLHVLVTASALWYTPQEVEFYLIDFKKGVEFKAYVEGRLPHVKAVAVESDREFGLSVLQRLDAELTKRGEMFRRAGVQEINSYRKANPGEALPRVLLVVDEFQEFFTEDDKIGQEAASLIDRLVRQGRAFGMHVLLGSQTIGGSAGIPRATLGQMAVRVALQTSEADSTMILGESNTAARLLTRPGEAIYNDNGGLPEANSPFQVAWLPDSRRDAIMVEVAEEARKRGWESDMVVFEGNKPADMSENRELRKMVGGEQPTIATMLLGEPVAIKPTTRVLLRRQPGANVLMIGQQEEAALASMQGALLSLAGQKGTSFTILDGTMAESPLKGKLTGLADRLAPAKVDNVEYRDAEAAVLKLHDELARRQEDPDASHPLAVLAIYGLQRYRGLRKSGDDFSFSMSDEPKKLSADKAIAEILKEGPAVGIHVIAWADTLAAVERVFDRALMREFDSRVLFQMSANDSSTLIDSPAGNRLGQFRALLFSEEQGVMEKFRPFAVV